MHLDIAPLLVACQDRPVEFASYHYEGLWVRQVPNRQDPTDVYFQMDFVKFDDRVKYLYRRLRKQQVPRRRVYHYRRPEHLRKRVPLPSP